MAPGAPSPKKTPMLTKLGINSGLVRLKPSAKAGFRYDRLLIRRKMLAILALLPFTSLLVGCGPQYKYAKNPKVDAAIAEAQASLTNFTIALQSPNSNQMFFRVNAWFTSKPTDYQEGVWVDVWKYENQSFVGVVQTGNARIGLTNNERVSINASNVFDWAYLELGKGVIGDFTDHAFHGRGTNWKGGAKGKEPLGAETNRASSAASSRRSP
jgi:uncharacterized protein YegJ (DUF2314 family)